MPTLAHNRLAAIIRAFTQARSIDPLIRLLDDDRNLTSLAQAFVAAALGGIGDKDDLPWNSVLATDINYRARVDTMTNGRSGILDIL